MVEGGGGFYFFLGGGGLLLFQTPSKGGLYFRGASIFKNMEKIYQNKS